MSENRRHIGIRDVGEISEPFNYQFLEHDGTVEDLTGYTTAQLDYRAPDGTEASTPAAIVDAANGIVQLPWVAALTAQTGEYRGQVWVTNGTQLFPGIELVWRVKDGPGPI